MPRKADPQTAEGRQQVQRAKGSQTAVAQNFPEFFVQSAAARGVPKVGQAVPVQATR